MPPEQVKIVDRGIVLRETETKETDKILTVLTEQMGKISVIARGARRKNSRLAAGCQTLAYSEMTLYRRGRWYYLDAADPLELFDGLGRELERLSLGSYFAELTEFLAGEETPAPELLRLLLNGLFALSALGKPEETVKPAFTFRLLALSGFEPLADGCAVCGTEQPEEPMLDVVQGFVHCRRCKQKGGLSLPLTGGSHRALRYILHCPDRRLYSYSLPPDGLAALDRAAEAFASAQLERSFRTLDYYKSLKDGLSAGGT